MSGARRETISHVVVGYGNLVVELDRALEGANLLVLEEPEIIEARGVRDRTAKLPSVAGLLGAPTQSETEPDIAALVGAVDRPDGVRAVIPVNEYAVVAAAALAEAWGLPGAGLAAARVFRDKIRLREAAGAAGIPQPAWAQVTEAEQVAALRERWGGHCVIKPANRQASLGVSILGPDDPVEEAWRETVGVQESQIRTDRVPADRHLAEQRMWGPEVSVETLVHDGRVVFGNTTAKLVQPGRNPVELGHEVPATLPASVVTELRESVRRLVEASGFRYGVLHSEWILVADAGPHLVECAARMPGDNIPHLISLAYDRSMFADLAAVLEGRLPRLPAHAVRGAAIRFLTAGSGTVRTVTGCEAVAAMPGVHEIDIEVAAGDRLCGVMSSWQRSGHVMTTAATGAAAMALAEVAAGHIEIVVEDLAC